MRFSDKQFDLERIQNNDYNMIDFEIEITEVTR